MRVGCLPDLSRRELFGAGMVVAGVSLIPALSSVGFGSPPVVSVHRDQPYLDPTGTAEPYRPALATDWADAIDDEALFRLGFGY